MPPLRRLAAGLMFAAACASASPPPAPEPGVLSRLLDLPLERRGAALTAFVREARPRLLLEVVPPSTFEADDGRLLPIGLDDFDILRVAVELDDPDLTIRPAIALAAEGRPGALPLYAPTRDLFVAFTRERPAGSHTRYRLKSAGLPWLINILTVGVLELATLEVTATEVQPDDADQIRATPRAQKLAVLITPPHGCADGRVPCDRFYVVPRPRDEVPLRVDLDLQLGDAAGPAIRVRASLPLPAGKPLAERLADRFHGAAIALEPTVVEPANLHPDDPTLCRLDRPRCAAPSTARDAAPRRAPPPVPPPAQLATPAESLAARPTWSDTPGYAPPTTLERLAPEDLVPGGPLRDALLVCDFTVRGGPDPASLVAEARVGALPPHRPGVSRSGDRARLLVPLVHLDPGESVALKVWLRTSSWWSGVHEHELGRATLKYSGALPLTHDARGLAVSCVALGRAGVEREAEARIAALAEKLAAFDIGVDPISEGNSDWGMQGWGMRDLQRRVAAIAGLVGWSDPRIAPLRDALAHYHAVFLRHLGRLLAAKLASLPAPGAQLSFEHGDLRIVGSACGDAIDRKRVLWARDKVPADGCVTIVEVTARDPEPLDPSPRTGSLGAIWSLELAWADGRRVDAWSVGVEPPPGKRRDPERLHLAPGESARFYLAPVAPYHREGEPPPILLYALDGLNPVFLRLR